MNDSYLHRLNNSESPGPDGIVPKLIKIVASVIVRPLTHKFIICLNFGLVPDALKLARIIPVYKNGCRT